METSNQFDTPTRFVERQIAPLDRTAAQSSLSSIAPRAQKLIVHLLFGLAVLGTQATVSLAQAESPFAIRIDTREVVVPVFVIDKSYFLEQRFRRGGTLHIDRYYGKEITGLSAMDFHVFEDGSVQQIQNVSVEPLRYWGVSDNVSAHEESSCTPRGIWAGPDLQPRAGPQQHFRLGNQKSGGLYLVSYVPPPSPEGSCHQIEVKVDRDNVSVSARNEYCNTKYPPSDPLNGTKLGKQMEAYAESNLREKSPISVQIGSFLGDFGAVRVDIAAEFSASAFKRKRGNTNPYATIAVLGMVFDRNSNVVARFSDSACYSSGFWSFFPGTHSPPASILKELEHLLTPNRYETQVDLPPGEYDLKLVVTDGEKFARAEVPLQIDGSNRNGLAISGISLCKRFHKVTDGPPEGVRAPQYVPLVSNGIEFTPAGNTRFKKNDRLMSYFEIREPPLAGRGSAKARFQMKVMDAKTGELKTDAGVQDVDSGVGPGSFLIPVAREVAIDRLPKGTYCLEVQASDSAGNKTVWRAASFTVE
ncbi:MAG: hypothetical protein ABSE19_02070 [Candidatus Acidiferrum sp.]|jgi:hypothetical protein